ncbi:MAG: 50S ribosomal protein L3 N(5)-glutamine methyltransferase [Aeromonadales bacterium]|nr:50S ribosomal protein L3 N(5)-glutamine methyltransferase [Aeromonadales bacterium]
MSKLQNNQEILEIHSMLDELPNAEQIQGPLLNELITVQDVVRYLVSNFAKHSIFVGHGTDNYWDEALEILQAVMHLQPPCDDSTLNSKLTRKEREIIAKIAAQRIINRIPTPYLTHRAFFCGKEFYVDDRVIIPRSPIAELIEKSFDPYIERRPERVLDMCTGSGCIAIAIAMQFEGDVEVDAVDISDEALEVANINIQGYCLENVVTPIKSDLFDNLMEGDKYDVIVANPPYVDSYDLSTMPDEFRCEPDLALGSGDDGLDCAKRILADAVNYLNDDGILIMEVGNSEEQLVDLFPTVPFHFVDLKRGGTGVFILTVEQLRAYHEVFAKAAGEVVNAGK